MITPAWEAVWGTGGPLVIVTDKLESDIALTPRSRDAKLDFEFQLGEEESSQSVQMLNVIGD